MDTKPKLEEVKPEQVDLKKMTKCEVGNLCHRMRTDIDRLQANYQIAATEYQGRPD